MKPPSPDILMTFSRFDGSLGDWTKEAAIAHGRATEGVSILSFRVANFQG